MAARKDIIVAVRSDVQNVKQGFAEVRDAITDMMAKSGQGTESFIVNAGRVVGGLSQSLGIMGGHINTLMAAASKVADVAKGTVALVMDAGKRARLEDIVSDELLERLRGATQGLVTDMDLLSASAKAMQGEFALTENQLSMVGLAATALHQQGLGPTSEIFAKLTDGLRRGATGAMAEYGVVVEKVEGTQNKVNAAMAKLQDIAMQAKVSVGNMSDGMQANLVALENAWDDSKNAIGSAIGEMIRHIDDLSGATDERIMKAKAQMDAEQERLAFIAVTDAVSAKSEELRKRREERISLGFIHNKDQNEQELQHLVTLGLVRKEHFEQRMREIKEEDRARDEARKRSGAADSELAAAQRAAFAESSKQVERELEMQRRMEASLRNVNAATGAYLDVTIGGMEDVTDKLLQLTKIEDPIAEMWQRLTEDAQKWRGTMVDLGVGGFQEFADAGGQAFAMLATGQAGALASLGEAVKQILFGLASEMQARAIMQLDLGIANSFWNPPAAATHFAAAAVFEAGALAFGAAAAIAGAPGGGGGAAAAPRPSGEGRSTIASGGGGGNTIQVVNNIGYGFVGDERALRRQLAQMTQDAVDSGAHRPNQSARRS